MMNPFEKVFNYQLMNSLDSSGIFIVTAQERAWLKMMLAHPAAKSAFDNATLEKLTTILANDKQMELSTHLMQKGQSKEREIYHPLLRPLRKMIMNQQGMKLSFEIKRGGIHEDISGIPYKLEFSMVKRQWFLLWFHTKNRRLMSTRLDKIVNVSSQEVAIEDLQRVLNHVEQFIQKHKTKAKILINPMFNGELSRILYAFSYFEKKVHYDEEEHTYTIEIQYASNEEEFVLSRIRFLGQRVKVLEGDFLKKRLLEAATKALERYGVLDEQTSVKQSEEVI